MLWEFDRIGPGIAVVAVYIDSCRSVTVITLNADPGF